MNRVRLRKWEINDAFRLYELASSNKVGPLCGWSAHKDVEESKTIIENILSKDENYAVVLNATDEIIGCISLMLQGQANIELKKDEAELGYWLGETYWECGYMVEAARLLIDYGFDHLSLSRIWCGNFADNKRSARVKEKLGFVHQYTMKDQYVSALNLYKDDQIAVIKKEDWR